MKIGRVITFGLGFARNLFKRCQKPNEFDENCQRAYNSAKINWKHEVTRGKF